MSESDDALEEHGEPGGLQYHLAASGQQLARYEAYIHGRHIPLPQWFLRYVVVPIARWRKR